MKKALLLAAAALSLSSCYTFWNTGKKMKENAVTYTGLDMAHPIGDVVYKSGGKFYAELPEVTYHTKHTLCGVVVPSWEKFSDDPDKQYVAYLKPTGRTSWAEVQGDVWISDGAFHFERGAGRPVAGCPAGAKPIPFASNKTGLPTHPDEILQTAPPRRNREGLYNAAAVPLTYVVDPVLTGVTTAVMWVAATPYAAGLAVGGIICSPSLIISQQQQQPTPADTPENDQ